MITQKQHEGFKLAMRAGEIMMKNGGEIYRVENVVTHICYAFDIEEVDIFTTPTGMFASIHAHGENSDTITSVKAIRSRTTDLHKISDVNNLSREISSGKLSVEEAHKKLDDIDKGTYFSKPIILLGAGLACSILCLLFGGTLLDTVAGFIIALFAYLLSDFLGKKNVSYFILGSCCCSFATFLALLAESFGMADNHDYIVIGVLMLYLPGALFTNSLRDILTGDFLSGITRLTEAITIALSLAVGTGLMLKIWSMVGGMF